MKNESLAQEDTRPAVARLGGWACVLGASLVLLSIVAQGAYSHTGAAISYLLGGAASLMLLNRGHHQAAYRLLILAAWLGTLIGLVDTSGIRSNLVVAFPIIFAFAVWLTGPRAMLILGVATLAVVLGLALADHHALLPPMADPPLAQQTFILLVILAASLILFDRAARTQQRQLRQIDDSHRQLREQVAALARRQEELRLITENVPAMIARFDRDQICRFANSAYLDFHGHSPAAILGQRVADIVGPQAHGHIASAIERVLRGEAVSLVFDRHNAQGEPRTLGIDLVPDRDAEGKSAGWYVLLRDITEATRLSRALRHIVEGTARTTGTEFFRALTLNLALATDMRCALVVEVQPDGSHARALAYWNGGIFRDPKTYRIAGAPCEQVLAWGEACFVDGVAERFPQDTSLARQGVRSYYGVRMEARDGTPLGLLIVMDGRPIRHSREVAEIVSVFAARAAGEIERLRNETALQRSSERFAKAFATSPIPTCITRLKDGHLVDINPAYERTFGWRRDEVLQHTSLELGTWASAADRQAWLDVLLLEQRHQDHEITLFNRQGDRLPILISAEVIDLDGEPHLIVFLHDQTRHRQLEAARLAALKRFEVIFQNTPSVAIRGFDEQGILRHWNTASATLYGLSAQEVIGRPVQSLFDARFIERFEQILAQVRSSGQPSEPLERAVRHRDGTVHWVLSTLQPVQSEDRLLEFFCMEVDITEMKRAAEAVQELNRELEARVAERTAELAAVNRELEAFSYTVSHDLRAPLRSIEGFGRLLELEHAAQLDPVGRDYVSRMRRAAQRLAQLIDDLLELSRINRAEIHPESVDLGHLAEEIMDELRQADPQRPLQFHSEANLRAWADPALLRIALQNLLDNAWKYSSQVAQAQITLGSGCHDGHPCYYVRDNGAGFDMRYAEKLFVPFQRLHSPSEFEGTGVGLASTAQVIRRHGGEIWAEAAPGEGATFYFTLPAGATAS